METVPPVARRIMITMPTKKAQSDEVDRILEKLKKSGYDSLTTEEKKSLFDASKR